MDAADFHTIYTVLMVIIFIAIVIWAWSSKTKKRFKEAANLPFADEPLSQTGRENREKETRHE